MGLVAPNDARAACGRVEKVTQVTPFFVDYVHVPVGQTASFETFGLTPGSDTVLHLQKAGEVPEWGFGGGNDDCPPGYPTNLNSCVTLASTGYNRWFIVVVRAYSDTTAGQARLRKTIGGSVTETSLFTFAGKTVLNSLDVLHESDIDKFVEADWVLGSQMSIAEAQGFVDFFKEPGVAPENNIRLHVDMGVENPNPAGHPTLLEWGNWGGANVIASQVCDRYFMASNRSMFHLGVLGTLAQDAVVGHWCFRATNSRWSLAHELGHNMFLTHVGSRLSGEANWKAVYESTMNYGYSGNSSLVRYSSNKYGGIVFNPTNMNETTWQGSNNGSLAFLAQWPFFYRIEGKAVDWNQDNLIQDSAAAVPGRVNAPGESGHMRGATLADAADPTLVRLRDASGDRLYMFTRKPLDAMLRKRYANSTILESSCSVYGNPWIACATWTAESIIPGHLPVPPEQMRAPAVVEFVAGATRKLLLVWTDPNGWLKFQTMHLSSGNEIWTTPALIEPNPQTLTEGAPAAAWDAVAGRVDVYAISSGILRRWSYNIAASSWDTLAIAQTWTTGANVSPTAGVGLSWGYQKGTSGQQLYALVPYGAIAYMDIGRRSPSVANQWEKLATTTGKTDARPGFVYRPYRNGTDSVQDGRFMYLIRDLENENAPVVGVTEGNDTNGGAPHQRLCVWKRNLFTHYDDRDAQSAAALFYEPGFDSNVRGARSVAGGAVQFFPLADGFVNFGFRDYHDYAALKANAGCGVGGPCKYCQAINLDGTCTSFDTTNPPLP